MGVAVFELDKIGNSQLVMTGSASYNDNDQVFWDCQATIKGIKEKPFRLVYGFVDNSKISSIEIKDTDQVYYQAKMIDTSWKTIWFKEINYEIQNINIIGLSSKNEIMYEFGKK